nr:helix-turn-helix domain-containing protein [Muricauda sp. CAU 1633]
MKTIAERLGTNSKYISQAINHKMGKSFTQWVNDYRVEEAKQRLLDPKNEKLTLEAIGNTSGFHTKSSFFSAFKKSTGLTPSQFVNAYKK